MLSVISGLKAYFFVIFIHDRAVSLLHSNPTFFQGTIWAQFEGFSTNTAGFRIFFQAKPRFSCFRSFLASKPTFLYFLYMTELYHCYIPILLFLSNQYSWKYLTFWGKKWNISRYSVILPQELVRFRGKIGPILPKNGLYLAWILLFFIINYFFHH